MIERDVRVADDLEARGASLFVQAAGKFVSDIHLNINDKTISAKSLMGVIAMELEAGSVVTLSAEGEDAEDAVAALSAFLAGAHL